MKSVRGFTLLELIVALGIFGVLAAMAYGGLNSALGSRTIVEQKLQRTVDMQKAYLRLREDLQQMRDRTARDEFGESQPALRTVPDGRVEFTRGGWRNPLTQPRSTLERLSYTLDEKEHRLLRQSWRVLDPSQESARTETVVLEGVDALEWRFLSINSEWQAVWPPPQDETELDTPSSVLPRAVEVKLETRDWGELTWLFKSS